MPNDASNAAWINAAAQGLNTSANVIATSNLNKKSREWSEYMYQRQRDDAISFWHMQNAYNSPQAQMLRFSEAGLNPHLIYGRGDSGNAGSIPVPNSQRPDFNVPDLSGIGGAVMAYMNVEQRQAQRS